MLKLHAKGAVGFIGWFGCGMSNTINAREDIKRTHKCDEHSTVGENDKAAMAQDRARTKIRRRYEYGPIADPDEKQWAKHKQTDIFGGRMLIHVQFMQAKHTKHVVDEDHRVPNAAPTNREAAVNLSHPGYTLTRRSSATAGGNELCCEVNCCSHLKASHQNGQRLAAAIG
jgi:hypothetical protein